jgi:hypothetical protein
VPPAGVTVHCSSAWLAIGSFVCRSGTRAVADAAAIIVACTAAAAIAAAAIIVAASQSQRLPVPGCASSAIPLVHFQVEICRRILAVVSASKVR